MKKQINDLFLNSWDPKPTQGDLKVNMLLKSMSLLVLSTFNCSFTWLLSNTLKNLSKNFKEYPFLKNIVFNFSTSLKNNSRVEQRILALLSAPRSHPYSNAVYKYICLCNTSLNYIGKTKRHSAVRSEEHLRF